MVMVVFVMMFMLFVMRATLMMFVVMMMFMLLIMCATLMMFVMMMSHGSLFFNLTSANLQPIGTKLHVDETGVGILRMLIKYLPDTYCSLGILGYHV